MSDPERLIPDDVLEQTAKRGTHNVPLVGLTWVGNLVVDCPAAGVRIDTEGPGWEEVLFTTADLARQLLAAREALFEMLDHDDDTSRELARACLPECEKGDGDE